MTMIKRSVMTLYSTSPDIYCHQVRIVLAEKGVTVDILNIDQHNPCEDLLELNPYNTLPTLVDRDLVLYDANIIMEYLDERFPHPPLLPVYPVQRARSRLMIFRIERDWYDLFRTIESTDNAEEADTARQQLLEALVSLNPIFSDKPYFLSEEFSMIDCVIAPLLWRFPHLGIKIPRTAKGILRYASRVFERDAFQASLTENEREMRAA